MSWIPIDPAIRVRLLQADSGLPSIAPLKEVTAVQPNLQPGLQAGDRFSARIQEALPDNNSYRALVGNKEVTLLIPGSVKANDTLELVVVEANPRVIRAQLATPSSVVNTAAGEAGVATEGAQLSPAGQLIGKLLLPAGQAAQPVPLNQGAPLIKGPLPAANELAGILAPRLAQAASQSGLFYEAHQALWVSGQRSTESLMAEPQARHGVIYASNSAAATLSPDIQKNSVEDVKITTSSTQLGTEDQQKNLAGSKDLMQSIPAELRPLVQQQLDAAAAQRLAWHGEVWAGQTMQWQISRDAPNQPRLAAQEAEKWNTSLALTTPGLGRVEAALGVTGNTISIRLAADSPESVSKLNRHLPKLHSALEAAGLKLAGLQVARETP